MAGTVHVHPRGDLIEHDLHGTDCACGPTAEHVPTDKGDGWLVVHHSRDGREQREGHASPGGMSG